jgi:hypothetical protein
MKNRLGIATVLLVALLGLTLFRMNAREAEVTGPAKVEIKLAKIAKDSLDELEVSGPEKPRVKLVKKDGKWRVAEPVDAEADQDAVSTALDKLAELEVTGVAATNKKNHDRLEVDGAKGTRVIARAGGKTLLDGYIGIYQTGNSMLRIEGQEPVATVRGSIRYAFNKALKEWRDRTITKVETSAVQELVFDGPNGHFHFAREGEAWKQVVKKGEKALAPLDESKVKGMLGTAASLSAVDFAAPGVTPEQAGLGEGAATALLKLGGDAGVQEVRYRIGKLLDQNHYLQREGVPTIFLVSSWVAGRLTPKADILIKKETETAAGVDPNAEPPLGAPGNPIKVAPMGSGGPTVIHNPPGFQLPPGHPPPGQPTKPGAAPKPPAASKPAAAPKPATK